MASYSNAAAVAPALTIDRLVLRFEAHAENLNHALLETNRHSATVEGFTWGEPSPSKVKLDLPIDTPAMQAVGTARMELCLPPATQGAGRISGFMSVNPLVCLRGMLGSAAGPAGLDGKPNVTGPSDAIPDAQESCIAIVAAASATVFAAADELLGPRVRFENAALWLSAFEATRDIPMRNAVGMAHRLARGVLDGALFVERDLYGSRATGLLDRGYATTRLYRTKKGAAIKVYAKGPDLLRMEWALDDRDAVQRELGGERVESTPQGAEALVRRALEVARVALAAVELEVLAVCDGTATPADVALALRPLLDLAAADGPVARGRPPAVPTTELAHRAFNALVLTGYSLLPGDAGRGRLRTCLDGLVQAGALTRAGPSLCYALAAHLVSGLAGCEIAGTAHRRRGQAA